MFHPYGELGFACHVIVRTVLISDAYKYQAYPVLVLVPAQATNYMSSFPVYVIHCTPSTEHSEY
jgi:hypothetical protein